MLRAEQKVFDNGSSPFVIRRLSSIEQKLAGIEESLAIFKHGMAEIKKKHIEEYKAQGRLHEIDFQHKLLRQVSEDASLTEPLKKLMRFMIEQFDAVNHQFKELNFSSVRNESPVSGGKVSGYLNELVQRSLLIKRDDGYHAYYKINYKAYEEKQSANRRSGSGRAGSVKGRKVTKTKRNKIPSTATERMLRKAGAAKLSRTAIDALTKALEKTGKDISKKAVNLARHAHRKTVRGEDVETCTIK